MKYLSPLMFAALLAVSCSTKDNEHTDSFVHAKVDSIVGERMQEINRRAMEDLDQRMTIEVKAKADSIIAARRAAAMSDTAPAASRQPMP